MIIEEATRIMSSIDVSLRVTGYCNQGDRKHMEDVFSIAFDPYLEYYTFFGIFDGHGGPQAAKYAKENLIVNIVKQRLFWSTNDKDILRAIRDGFIATHNAMWRESENWPKKRRGLPSTSGCTATVAFIMRGKIFVGHTGDSAIVLGYQENGMKDWKAKVLTKAHKPNDRKEKRRIERCGGRVVKKDGVHRVVFKRPKLNRKGEVKNPLSFEEIPFLAIARSLGDFWSYNSSNDKFTVSPKPDVHVYPVDITRFRCLVLGTDGLWDVMSAKHAVSTVQSTEIHNQKQKDDWLNPSKTLVDTALKKYAEKQIQADNTSAVTLMLDPDINDHSDVEFQVLFRQMDKSIEEASLLDKKSTFSVSELKGIPIIKHIPSTKGTVNNRNESNGNSRQAVLTTKSKKRKRSKIQPKQENVA